MVKNLPTNAGDVGYISGSGRAPEGGNGTPLQYSCLENPRQDREKPGGLQSMGLPRVRHNWETKYLHTDATIENPEVNSLHWDSHQAVCKWEEEIKM